MLEEAGSCRPPFACGVRPPSRPMDRAYRSFAETILATIWSSPYPLQSHGKAITLTLAPLAGDSDDAVKFR